MPAAQAVETLITDYGKLVFHVILGLTSDWQESQDLTQDTFVQALRAIDAARSARGAHFHAKAWLLQIAVNNVRMYRRRRSIMRVVPFSSLREEEQEETEIESIGERADPVQPAGYGMRAAPDPADLIAERDAVQQIMYNHLSEAYRILLLLSIVAGFSSREIARMLGLREATVRQRLARARKAFQLAYRQELGEQLLTSEHTASMTRHASRSADRLGHRPAALAPTPS